MVSIGILSRIYEESNENLFFKYIDSNNITYFTIQFAEKTQISCGGDNCSVLKKFYSAAYYRKLDRAGSYIGLGAKFIKWPYFPHGITGIFISGSAKIGKGCTIFQQVTIGSNTLPDSKGFGAPIIGDNVYIGAGAKIIGNVHVGDRCRIGANAVVVRDVPADTVVYIGDIHYRTKKGMDNRFYSQINGKWYFLDDDGVPNEVSLDFLGKKV